MASLYGKRKARYPADLQKIYKAVISSLTPVIYMRKFKERLLRIMQQRSNEKVAMLSKEYLRARPEEKESIMAGIEIEKWLSEVCDYCLN